MPSKYQNLIIHWFHIFILIFNHVDTIFNCIKIDILDRHFHSKIHFLLVYILHTRFLHNTFLLYTFLLYAITRYFGIIHFFQASSIKPDQSWVQSVKNIKLIISPAAVTFHTSCVWYIRAQVNNTKAYIHSRTTASKLKDHNSIICDHSGTFVITVPAWLMFSSTSVTSHLFENTQSGGAPYTSAC